MALGLMIGGRAESANGYFKSPLGGLIGLSARPRETDEQERGAGKIIVIR
jgi:hypothetical protein